MDAPENFSVPRSKFCKPEQWFDRKVGYVLNLYGQLTKQHRFCKKKKKEKKPTNRSFLPQLNGFRMERVVLERV